MSLSGAGGGTKKGQVKTRKQQQAQGRAAKEKVVPFSPPCFCICHFGILFGLLIIYLDKNGRVIFLRKRWQSY